MADHYFVSTPGGSPRRKQVRFRVADREFTLDAAGGVFSADRLDPGTAVLLRKSLLPAPDALGPFLDLGCGYGPMSAVLASTAVKATVWAVDVNARARELTSTNMAALGVADRVRVVEPDQVPAEVVFAGIWSNPPIRIGKEELHALLARWLTRLAPDGVAWLVAARHLGGDSLQRWLTEHGWPATRHASQKGYRVLRVTHPT